MPGQPDYTGSAMLALYPDAAAVAALALPGGLDPAPLHVTLVYTGDAADTDPEALNLAAKTLAARPPITAQISGHARFTGGEKDVLIALVDSPDLEDLRRAATGHCADAGIDFPREHGYTPHCSLVYLDPADPPPLDRLPAFPVTFAAVSAVHGDTRTDHPFTGGPAQSPESLARAAFATGWARSGGPMTDRVKAGCAAAMHLAREHAHDPGVIEVALKLGSLEGAWALVYQRREQQIAEHAAAANTAWRAVLTRDQIAGAVQDLRRRLGLAEDEQADPDRDRRIRDAATAAATAMLQLLPGRPAWQGLRTALRDALAAGQAEGIVGAVAIAAEQIDRVGLDWNIAFEHAYASLDNLELLWGQADGWLGRMLERATTDLGRALATAARSDATYEQMLADAMDALGSDDSDAVSFIVDWAMTEAQRRGALDLYLLEGVPLVDWLTAGDTRVCFPAGTSVASPLGDVPIELLHPGDLVVTPEGNRPVVHVGSRPYAGGMTIVRAQSRTVAATDDHPFRTVEGWKPASDLRPGDLIQSLGDQVAEVDRVVHLTLSQPQDPPSAQCERGVADPIPVPGRSVPVVPIDLEGDGHLCEREVYGPPPNGVLLPEGYFEEFERLANLFLKQGLTPEAQVTRSVAEPSVQIPRLPAESLSAREAVGENGNAPALFRTEAPVEVLLTPESLSASLAVDILGISGPASRGANPVPVRDRALCDREVESADRTVLRDAVRPIRVIAGAGTEASAGCADVRWPERRVAVLARPVVGNDREPVVALTAAEYVLPADTGVTHEFFCTVIAREAERHEGNFSEVVVAAGGPIQVYDIEVAQEHVFFANGFLVHNCAQCDDNEANGPYPPSDYPAQPHPRCRCSPASLAPFSLANFDAWFTDA